MLVLKIAAGIILAFVILGVGISALVSSSTGSITSSGSLLSTNDDGSGTYLVGSDVQPGTYRLPQSGSSPCYWARLSDVDGDSIIANDLTWGPSVIHILSTDYAVEFSGCDTSAVLG